METTVEAWRRARTVSGREGSRRVFPGFSGAFPVTFSFALLARIPGKLAEVDSCRANGAEVTSPGQRPGYCAQALFRPERAEGFLCPYRARNI